MDTPKSLRVRIGLFGKTNCGKSSLLNLIANQNVSIVSEIRGTTTDSVEKNIELSHIGPTTFIDTAGINDDSELGKLREEKTYKVLKSCNVVIIVSDSFEINTDENKIIDYAQKYKIPYIIIFNKIDLVFDNKIKRNLIDEYPNSILVSATEYQNNIEMRNNFLKLLIEKIQIAMENDKENKNQSILKDIIVRIINQKNNKSKNNENDIPLIVLVTPIDSQAPKGRLILPQVQTIRDALDNNAIVIVTKTENFLQTLSTLKKQPQLVICDSQVINEINKLCPSNIKLTTFSILFSKLKGDFDELVKGAFAIQNLKSNDKILIAESCSHHPNHEDIGRIKIPNLIKKFTNNKSLIINHCAGKDFPSNLDEYKLIIHCGGCMLNRKEMLIRIHSALESGCFITNYGMAISVMQGGFERVLEPLYDNFDYDCKK